MNKLYFKILVLVLLINSSLILCIYAQETVATAGADISGTDGTISFTVGQIANKTIIGSNGYISEGVHQPIEISTISKLTKEDKSDYEINVYPNPTNEFVFVKINNKKSEQLNYQLFDINNKLIESNNVSDIETKISLIERKASTYFLKISNQANEIQTFKIIKN
ncbi:MAG: hypothetical protein A2033_08935 [Bacteroidetes bacterium GWA2_31_9]|nr:MAG: hypothetical protein A2033_08935 [Bacteroidetes bacterium GWA2_31_9]